VKGLALLACKTDRIDAWVLAELSRRDLVPAIWLPTPEIRAERERARSRLQLVKRRNAVKNRVHSIVIAFGYARLASDLFGVAGRAQHSSSPTCTARYDSSTSPRPDPSTERSKTRRTAPTLTTDAHRQRE
jgi:hypothetical protein